MTNLKLADQILDRLPVDRNANLALVSAESFRGTHVPMFASDSAAMILSVSNVDLLAEIKIILMRIYPAAHLIFIADDRSAQETHLGDLDPSALTTYPVSIYVSPLEKGSAFESFQEIIAHLRAPDGCPWDKEQTHRTLRTHLLQESYEAIAALDSGSAADMREEFGDLLLQIVLQVQIAQEFGEFTMPQVIKGIYDKILRRHPHVFGKMKVDDVDGVLQNWEKLKADERKQKGEHEKSLLDGVSIAQPALTQAQEYQARAARVGFDWAEISGVLDKVREEIEEVKTTDDQASLEAELGDLFFALVNLARWKNVDAESVLRSASAKFKRRFGYVEKTAKDNGRALQDMTLEEMDVLWNEAKLKEKSESR